MRQSGLKYQQYKHWLKHHLKYRLAGGVSLYPLTALALAACGGGGGSSSPPPPQGTDPHVNPPVLTLNGSQTLVLHEGTVADTMATGYSVTATDEDGDNVRFLVSDNRFAIADDGTLNVLANRLFDFEAEPTVMLAITAIDDSDLALSTARTVEIVVTDVTGDPVISVIGRQTLILNEGTIGTIGGDNTPTGYTVSVTDEDGDRVTLSVDDNRFAIADDGTLNIVAGSIFDFETQPNITLTITATDDSPDALTTTQEVTITVMDVIFSNVLTLAFVSNNAVPTFGDVDGDGDMDVLIGDDVGRLNFYRLGTDSNSAESPGTGWTAVTASNNPFDGINVGTRTAPAFGDVDGDGDLDLLVGNFSGGLSFFHRDEENDGTLSWVLENDDDLPTDIDSNVVGSAEVSVAPAFGDVDGDGDLDLLVGEHGGVLHFFRRDTDNDGEATWTEVTGENDNPFHVSDPVADPSQMFDVGGTATPTFGDVDGDGDMDLLVGNSIGNLHFFRLGEATDTADNPGTGWTAVTGSANPFDGFDVGTRAAPAFGDVDGDGDLDLLVGNGEGNLDVWYWLEDDTWSQTSDII